MTYEQAEIDRLTRENADLAAELARKNFEIRNLRANEESALRLAKALQNPHDPPPTEGE